MKAKGRRGKANTHSWHVCPIEGRTPWRWALGSEVCVEHTVSAALRFQFYFQVHGGRTVNKLPLILTVQNGPSEKRKDARRNPLGHTESVSK